MELRLDLQHKRFDTAPIARLFTQGENNVDVITLRGAKMYGALDASRLTFILRAVSEKDTLTEQQLTATTDGDDLMLTWTVTEDFTAVSGLLHLKLRGIDTEGNVVLKLGAEPIYIQADIQGDYAPPQDVLTKALNDMRGQVTAAEEQAGIAKTEADRLLQAGIHFKVLGFYPTLEALQTAVPNPARGDAYGVGDNPVYVYVWSGTEWQPGQALGIDLTTYYTKAAVDGKLAGKADGDMQGNANNALQLGRHPPAWYIQSNPNLLINGDFQIWQRGETVAPTTYGYTADRWFVGLGTANLASFSKNGNSGMKISFLADGYLDLQYKMDIPEKSMLLNKPLTISFSINGIVTSGTIVLSSLDDFIKIEYGTKNISVGNPAYTQNLLFALMNVTSVSGTSIVVNWVKLELGDHATPFVPRLYGEELALCQRYYEKPYNVQDGYSNLAILFTAIENRYNIIYVPFKSTKRNVPHITLISTNGTVNKISGSKYLNSDYYSDMDYYNIMISKDGFCVSVAPPNSSMLSSNSSISFTWTADAEL